MAAEANATSGTSFVGKGGPYFLLTTLATIALDQWTKSMARAFLLGPDGAGPRSIPLVGEVVRLTYVENRGAAFGLLQDQTTFFVLVGMVVVVVIIASYRQIDRPSWVLNLCLGLQLGGALGNLIDRVRNGYVVDFFDLTVWPVFNVADSAICVGVALLAWNLLFPGRDAERSSGG